jgi:hypothetical protein
LDLLGPRRAFTEPCRPLTFRCHCQARPSRFPYRPMRSPESRFLADRDPDVDPSAEGLRFVPPVRAERARARERLPSYREPPSRNPRPGLHTFLIGGAWSPRTVSPFLHPCPASGGASGFLPASALMSPRGLATSRCPRRAMRPIDVCHPYDLRLPAPRSFPVHSRDFRRVDVPRSLGSAQHDRGSGRFTAS